MTNGDLKADSVLRIASLITTHTHGPLQTGSLPFLEPIRFCYYIAIQMLNGGFPVHKSADIPI